LTKKEDTAMGLHDIDVDRVCRCSPDVVGVATNQKIILSYAAPRDLGVVSVSNAREV
jgi:hypothetical protein